MASLTSLVTGRIPQLPKRHIVPGQFVQTALMDAVVRTATLSWRRTEDLMRRDSV